MSEYFTPLIVGNNITELPKSKLPASAADCSGHYPFFCSSSEVKATTTWLQEKPTVLMGTGGVASVNYGKDRFAYSTDTWGFRSNNGKLETNFLFRKIQQYLPRIDYAGFEGSGLRHLRKDFVKKLKIEVPSPTVQSRMVEIIDSYDRAIEKTEALIAKYQQIKAGLMHDLFARGVTADGKLRPPRAQAPELYQETPIGWIPKEWVVKPLGTLAEIVSGVTLGSKVEISNGIEVPYLRVANVQDGYLDLTEVKIVRVSTSQFEKLQLRYGDVLMNEGGDFDKLGRGSVWREEIKPCIHQNHVFRVRPRDGQLRSYFLAFWSQSEMGKKYFVLNSKQSTNLASINSTQLNRFPVALPLSIEQGRIELRIIAHNGYAESLEQELAKLRQQKLGLMSDLLSGKIRVKTEIKTLELASG